MPPTTATPTTAAPATPRIECRWISTAAGLEVRARDPHARRWHRIWADEYKRLQCDCKAYKHSRKYPKTCKHLGGEQGAAGWINTQARHQDLPDDIRQFIERTKLDPLRIEAAFARKKRIGEEMGLSTTRVDLLYL
jgi:hypothetical protein